MASSNVCWGIDIGAGAVKALKLERDGDGVRVADLQIVPHKRVLSTPEINEADAIRVAMGSLMSQIRDAMKGSTVAVSVPGHVSFARFAKLPPVEPKGVPNLVRFEAVQQIPFPIEEVEWDYQLFASQDSPDVEVGIFAMTRERVNERLSLWSDVGLSPDILTLGPVAAYNAMAYDLSFTESTPGTILLDIGTSATDLVIAEGGRVWIRTFQLGGHNFTEALASTFKLPYSKAERLKAEAETSKYKKHIFQAIQPVLSDLVQDVQLSIQYYQDTHPDAKITRLIGVGSTFKLPGVRKLLSQQLKLEVYRYETFKRLNVEGAGAADFQSATPNLVTAYGLALQGLGLTPIHANLMPVKVVREALWRRKTPWFVAAAGLGLIGGGLSFLRPFLDSAKVRPVKQDTEVSKAISNGERLKNDWTRVQQENQPKFFAANVLRLFDGQELYGYVLRDVESIFSVANAHSEKQGNSGFAFELRELDTQYFPPGKELKASLNPGGGGGGGSGRDRDSGGDSGFGGGDMASDPSMAGAGGDSAAGQFGALQVTLVVDSQNAGTLTFFNDTVLAWLNANLQRRDVPYTIVKVPKIEEVSVTTIPAVAPPAGQADASPRPNDRQGQTGAPTPVGGDGAGSADAAQLDQWAPLPKAPSGVLDPAKPSQRYTVTWFVQLKELSPFAPPEPETPATGANGEPTAQSGAAKEEGVG